MKLRITYLMMILFSVSSINAQPKSNFELIDSLIVISVDDIMEYIDQEKKYNYNFIGSEDYSILGQRIKDKLINRGLKIIEGNDSITKIDFTMIEAKMNYPEIFQDHIFGNYLIIRSATIDYSFNIFDKSGNNLSKDYQLALTDTVLYSDLSRLENIAYTFSSSEIPDEPLFSSALEPIIAIGTAAVAVYLFFNIRSK